MSVRRAVVASVITARLHRHPEGRVGTHRRFPSELFVTFAGVTVAVR